MQSSELIEGFCRKTGIPSEMYESGTLSFQIENREMAIHALPEVNSVVLIGSLGQSAPGNCAELYRRMLRDEHLFSKTDGAFFSIHPETGRIAVSRSVSCTSITVDQFTELAEKFVETMGRWAEIVRDFQPRAGQPEEPVQDAGFHTLRV